MTDAKLAHAFPDLTDSQALLARLAETLEMARHLEATLQAINVATGAALDELIQTAGLPEELEAAGQSMRATIMHDLARISEQDLEQGRNAGLLTPGDYTDALKAKRTLSLSRGRSVEREQDREA